jgi:hypothetical protein
MVTGDSTTGDGGRRGGRAGEANAIEVGAQHVEDVLVERHAAAGCDVRRGRDDERTRAAIEVAEGRPVEQDLVVEVRREFGAAPVRRRQIAPVRGTESARDDLALDVALEEPLLVFGEELLAIQAVGESGEAAARHAGDHVDGVEQANPLAAWPHRLGAPEEFEHAVRERSRSRATARKGQDHEGFLVPEMLLPRLKRVALIQADFGEPRIDRARRAAGEENHRREPCEGRHAQNTQSPAEAHVFPLVDDYAGARGQGLTRIMGAAIRFVFGGIVRGPIPRGPAPAGK